MDFPAHDCTDAWKWFEKSWVKQLVGGDDFSLKQLRFRMQASLKKDGFYINILSRAAKL